MHFCLDMKKHRLTQHIFLSKAKKAENVLPYN
jgi:hypothetical protein